MKNLVNLRTSLFFVISLVWAPLGAQTFELTIDEHFDLEIPTEILIDDQNRIIVASSNVNVAPNRNSSTIYLINEKGRLIRKRELFYKDFDSTANPNLDFLSINSGIELTSNKFLFFAQLRIDTPATFAKLFFEMDSNLTILNSKISDTLVGSVQAYNRIKQFNGSLYASGQVYNNSTQQSLGQVGIIDNLIDDKRVLMNEMDSAFILEVFDFLVDTSGNKYYFGTGREDTINFIISPFQLLKADSSHQFLRREFISYPRLPVDIQPLMFLGSINAFWINDTSFLLTSNAPTYEKSDIHLFVYDTSFKQLNYKRITSRDSSEHSIFPKTAAYDQNCNCFYLGSTLKHHDYTTTIIGTGETTDFRLIKFDKNLNILFNRFYRRDKTMRFWTLKTDQDGNVIMVGEIQDSTKINTTNTDIFILKVDSLGNLNSPVGLPESETEINRLNFRFFPNPTKGLVNFRQYNVMEDYRMDLYDSRGRLLQQYRLQNSDNSIDLSDYPKGVYLYRLTDSKGRRASGKLVRE